MDSEWTDTAAGCCTHRVSDDTGEQRRFLIEAAEDQLADHQAEVQVERGESELVVHVALKCKTKTRRGEFRHTVVSKYVYCNLWPVGM